MYFHLPQESKVLKFLGFMWNPLSWVMEAAAIMAIALAHGGVNLYAFILLCAEIHFLMSISTLWRRSLGKSICSLWYFIKLKWHVIKPFVTWTLLLSPKSPCQLYMTWLWIQDMCLKPPLPNQTHGSSTLTLTQEYC